MRLNIFPAFLLSAVVAMSCCGTERDVIYANEEFFWYTDSVRQGDWLAYSEDELTVVSSFPARDGGRRRWECRNDISGFGTFSGVNVLETALYNMAADELINNIEADSTLRTGALWGGVWSRDVSYSIILSLADMVPEQAKVSLMRKVDRLGRIIQDTGTGGSWPCSSDRVIWAVAALRIYLATGDCSWLEQVYPIVKRSLESDLMTVYDEGTGLFRGESSFIDWREQSYPRWMQPVDIYQSECLGTNVAFYMALRSAGMMADRLGFKQDAEMFESKAESLKDAVNKYLWMEEQGYYGQFLYGRNAMSLSPRSETLGEALAIISGIASDTQSEKIISHMPVSPFGPTIFWPQISTVPSYHNDAIWPFVTSYYVFAAAKSGNDRAVMHGIASNVRAAAIFATNHENMVSSTGSLETQMNSHNMLWSLAGFLGTFRHVLLGMGHEPDGLSFSPFVPRELAGKRSLRNIAYRGMTLDVTVSGYGSGIRSFRLDGAETSPFVSADLVGHHVVEVELDGNIRKGAEINVRPYTASPDVPSLRVEDGMLLWDGIDGASCYKVLLDGALIEEVSGCGYRLAKDGEYQVIAVDASGVESFASEPLRHYSSDDVLVISVNRKLYRGRGLELSVNVPSEGMYAIDWEYSNGNGDITTMSTCANRALSVDGEYVGMSVFPQRGENDWKNAGWSNSLHKSLSAGAHSVVLSFKPFNENMSIDVNTVHVRSLRLTRL